MGISTMTIIIIIIAFLLLSVIIIIITIISRGRKRPQLLPQALSPFAGSPTVAVLCSTSLQFFCRLFCRFADSSSFAVRLLQVLLQVQRQARTS